MLTYDNLLKLPPWKFVLLNEEFNKNLTWPLTVIEVINPLEKMPSKALCVLLHLLFE